MKSKIISSCLLFSILFFTSFVSENNSVTSFEKETSKVKVVSNKNNLSQTKKQKLNFKERLALKLIKRKIKKAQKKQAKNIKSTKADGDGIVVSILLSVLLILGGLIGGIVALALGETLLGILLLVGGLIFVPLILVIILLAILLPAQVVMC
ncbi:hypothetical protein ACE193_18035 [Bernardetia sp. OM2101]|uniref:hypothetical protein n=1 Tax=Bernardetia sp. OM2101 TaxID=3344876 RepID=UPI0035D0436D